MRKCIQFGDVNQFQDDVFNGNKKRQFSRIQFIGYDKMRKNL